MKIRVISDLHIDVNKDNFELENKDIFTIIAGDIAGHPEVTTKWVQDNIKEGVFVEGNHCIYEGVPLQEVYETLKTNFPLKEPVSFLQNTYKIIGDYVFAGATLWTDFKLNSLGYYNHRTAAKGMNDYKYGKFIDPVTKKERKITTYDTLDEFRKSIKFIHNTCKNFPDKKIVVVTHHCPSMMCSSELYLNNMLNPAFISNLEGFIMSHSNIVAWVCGHCHRSPIIKDIGNCKLIMNTRGYKYYGEDKLFDPDFEIEI